MRVVFIDIDGVLNPHWRTKWSKPAITLFNQLCEEFDLKIVVTSTWRLNHTKEQLNTIFKEQGIKFEIWDYTPHIDQADRGLEINAWLQQNKVDDFVIIDDKTSDIVPHVKNSIKCRSWVGLSKDEFKEIKEILE